MVSLRLSLDAMGETRFTVNAWVRFPVFIFGFPFGRD
jgi:hypothetical protein